MQKLTRAKRILFWFTLLNLISLPFSMKSLAETNNQGNIVIFKRYIEDMSHWQTLIAEATMITRAEGYHQPIHLYFNFYHDRATINLIKTQIEIKQNSDHSKGMIALDIVQAANHQQWIYLPVLNLTKKITPDPKSRFFRTALTFRDMSLLDKNILLNQYEIFSVDDHQVILRLKTTAPADLALYSKIVILMDFKQPQIKEMQLFTQGNVPERSVSHFNFAAKRDKTGSLRPLNWTVTDKQHTTEVLWNSYQTNPEKMNPNWFNAALLKPH